MKGKRLNLILLLSLIGALLLVGVLGARRNGAVTSDTPVLIEQATIDVVDVDAIPVTPAPTPTPALPDTAVTLLVDRSPVLTLASEPETHRLLWEYLQLCAVAPENETFVSAKFAGELIITTPEAGARVVPFDEALALLQNMPELVPVEVHTLRTSVTEADVEKAETSEKALPQGSRIITQLGAGAITKQTVPVTYVANAVFAEGAPVTETVREARATIVSLGAYHKRDKSGEPGKNEGEKGKSAGELTLSYPMRGSVVSRFGFREGNIHSGLDVENKAGTDVSAPGEGVVIFCGERGAYGYTVDIDHGNGFVSRLTHLENVSLEINQRVFAGEKVGTLADNSTEERKPHLHYELIIDNVPYNPEYYLK